MYQKKEVALSQRISHIKEDARHVLSMSTNTNNLIITDYLCIHHRFFVYFNTKMSTSCLFRGWNILSIKCDKNSWNIIAHVYSPVKEVVVIDAQYTFRKWWWVSRLNSNDIYCSWNTYLYYRLKNHFPSLVKRRL